MSSLARSFDEYWRSTASTRQKLIEPKPTPKAIVLKYAPKPIEPTLAPVEVVYERACMLADDMNLPLAWAEAVTKLHAIERPQIIPQSSWLEIEAACTQLYTDDFALLKLIINNNWSLEDIYGCNKLAPLVRVDCMGLLLLHQGEEVASVNKERIKILRRSRKTNYFHRRLDHQIKVSLLYEL